MPLSNYVVDALLIARFGGDVYVGLVNGSPGDDGTGGSDVTATIHPAGRVLASFSAPALRQVANDAEVAFGNAAGAATVTAYTLWDAQVGGNFLGSGNLAVARPVAMGDPVAFLVNDLVVSLPGV